MCLVLAFVANASATRLQDNLFGTKAVSPQQAWVVGNFGSIYVTSDGGKTWEPQDSGTKMPLFGVDFADATHGWIVGQTGIILRTTDGGVSWTPQTSPVPGGKHFFNVAAVDRDTAWVVGDWGAIATTSDGGNTWKDASLGTLVVEEIDSPARTLQVVTDDVILYDVSFIDEQHGAIAGEFGTVLLTDDGGTTWRRVNTGTDKTLFGVDFVSAMEGWAVGIDGLVLHTSDRGESWEVQRGIIERSDIGELSFSQAMENPGLYAVRVEDRFGVVVGDTGTLLVSRDGGQTWARRELPGKDRLLWLRDVSLVSGSLGFLAGAEGLTATVSDGSILARGATAGGE